MAMQNPWTTMRKPEPDPIEQYGLAPQEAQSAEAAAPSYMSREPIAPPPLPQKLGNPSLEAMYKRK